MVSLVSFAYAVGLPREADLCWTRGFYLTRLTTPS